MRSRLRTWIACCGLVGALCLSGAAVAEAPQLNVYNWNDYIAHDTLASFQRRTGITVHYDLYDSNATLQGKLLTGDSGYDVVYPSGWKMPA